MYIIVSNNVHLLFHLTQQKEKEKQEKKNKKKKNKMSAESINMYKKHTSYYKVTIQNQNLTNFSIIVHTYCSDNSFVNIVNLNLVLDKVQKPSARLFMTSAMQKENDLL